MRVIVTGAASGIGRATCLRLARDGKARASRARRSPRWTSAPSPALDGVVGELAALGAEALALARRHGHRRRARRAPWREAVARFGGLDGLVSNAGINRPGPLVQLCRSRTGTRCSPSTRARPGCSPRPRIRRSRPPAAPSSPWRPCRAATPHANLGAYGPSKAPPSSCSAQVLAQELGRDGIRVNTVSPGMVRTGMTAQVYADREVAAARDALVPLGRVATPEDIADVIAFLLGPDAALRQRPRPRGGRRRRRQFPRPRRLGSARSPRELDLR